MGTAVKEITSVDGGYGYSGGYASAAGWGAGVLFLVLFLIILFGVMWNRDHHNESRDIVRDRFNAMGNDNAYQRGDIREILTNSIRSNERINDIWAGTRELITQGFNTRNQLELAGERIMCGVNNAARTAADSARFEADRILDRGLTFGFRTFDIVRPDPCRDACRGDGRNNFRVFDLNTGTQTGNAIGGPLNTLAAGAVQGPIAG